jgi:hypothetical protein
MTGVAAWREMEHRLALAALVSGVALAGLAVVQPVVAVAGLFAAVIVLLAVWRPYWLLIGFLFLVPFNVALFAALKGRADLNVGPLSNWKDVVLGLLVLRGLYEALRRHGLRMPSSNTIRLLIVYVLVLCLFAVASDQLLPAGYGLARDVEGPLLLLAIVALRPPRRVLLACLVAILAAALLMSVTAVIERVPRESLLTWYGAPTPDVNSSFYAGANRSGYRSSSFFDSPLVLGFYLSAALPLALAMAIALRRRARVIGIVVAGFAVAALGLTLTRTAYIGAALGTLTVLALALRGRSRPVLVSLVMIVVCSVLLNTLATGTDVLTRSQENHAHVGALFDDLNTIAARPFGYGIGTTDAVRFRFGGPPEITHASESNYLAKGIEGGVIGLTLYLLLLFVLGMRLRTARLAALRLRENAAAAIAAGALGALIGVSAAGLFLGVQELAVETVVWTGAAVALLLTDAAIARAQDPASASP